MAGATSDELTGPARLVEVQVDAVADQVPLLRAVAADVAIRTDFDLDAIEDLRMAVDEAGALLVECAADGARLTCLLRASADRITVSLAVPVRPGAVLSRTSMGWQILAALATELSTDVRSDGVLSIDLARARSEKITA